MTALIYQDVSNLVVSLPIRRAPGVLMNFRCGKIVVLTTRFFDVAKCTILTLLLLLLLLLLSSWCRLWLPIVGLKIFSLPTFALKSPNIIFTWYLGNDKKTAIILNKNCLMNNHFSPHLVHAHSEQWYYTSHLSELYMSPHL